MSKIRTGSKIFVVWPSPDYQNVESWMTGPVRPEHGSFRNSDQNPDRTDIWRFLVRSWFLIICMYRTNEKSRLVRTRNTNHVPNHFRVWTNFECRQKSVQRTEPKVQTVFGTTYRSETELLIRPSTKSIIHFWKISYLKSGLKPNKRISVTLSAKDTLNNHFQVTDDFKTDASGRPGIHGPTGPKKSRTISDKDQQNFEYLGLIRTSSWIPAEDWILMMPHLIHFLHGQEITQTMHFYCLNLTNILLIWRVQVMLDILCPQNSHNLTCQKPTHWLKSWNFGLGTTSLKNRACFRAHVSDLHWTVQSGPVTLKFKVWTVFTMKRKLRQKHFKGSCPSLKLQDLINRYLGSKTRPCPQNSFVGVIFQNGHKCLEIFLNKKKDRGQNWWFLFNSKSNHYWKQLTSSPLHPRTLCRNWTYFQILGNKIQVSHFEIS